MDSQDGSAVDEGRPGHIDWLDASTPSECNYDDARDSITLGWDESDITATIIDTPPRTELAINVTSSITLKIASDVQLPEAFFLRLLVGNDLRATCDIDVPVRKIICDSYPLGAAHVQRIGRHKLTLPNDVHVLIQNGHWDLLSQSRDPDVTASLAVMNSTQSLQIHSDAQVALLTNTGNHDYRVPLMPSAELVMCGGTAKFGNQLETITVSGTGDLHAHQGITGCQIKLTGDLVVPEHTLSNSNVEITGNLLVEHGNIHVTELAVTGKIKARNVTLGAEHSIHCEHADFAQILSAKTVTCAKRLTVQGPIDHVVALTAGSLRCDGPLSAESVTVRDDTHLGGQVSCDTLQLSGNAVIVADPSKIRALIWTPYESKRRLEIQQSDARMSSISVEVSRKSNPAPELYLAQGTEISDLRANASELVLATTQEAATRGHEQRSKIGLRLMQDGTLIRLAQHVVQVRLVSAAHPFSVEVPADTKLEVLECPDAIPKVEISGDGELRFEGENPDVRLRHVALAGSLKFHSDIGIDHLSAIPHPAHSLVSDARYEHQAPLLSLATGIVVERASGVCRLLYQHAMVYGDPKVGLKILGIEGTSSSDGVGHLINVDINDLPADQVSRLRDLRVLEILGKSLRQFAGERTRIRCALANAKQRHPRTSDDLEPSSGQALVPHEIRSRAEKVAHLADVLVGKVNSGSSRAWLLWAVARLQHRGLNKWSAERPFRAAYRMVGYGARPGPALLTWVAVAFVGLFYAWSGGYAGDAADIAYGWRWTGRFIEILLLPIGHLRLGGTAPESMFKPAAVDIVSRLVIGLPFLFSLLSIRQYFRSPVYRGQRKGQE